jgi:hypothetical protein
MRAMASGRSRNLLKNVGLVIASTLLSLLAAEGVVRLAYPQQLAVWHTMRDGLVVHPPGLVTHLTEFGQRVTFNSAGMRDREHSRAKPDGTARVLVLGDSFMEALQVSFEQSFPSLLEAGLRERTGRNVEVINLSVSGWGQDDQLAYLRKYGLAYEPDLILVAMTAHNDVLDNLRERFHTLNDGKLAVRPEVHMSEWEFRQLQLKGYFASRSHLWQLLRKAKNLREIRVVAADLQKHVAQLVGDGEESLQLARGWNLTFGLLRGIRDVGKSVGAEAAVMVIPLNLQLQGGALEGARSDADAPRGGGVVDRPQRAIGEFGRAAEIPVIDLLPQFRQETLRHRASLHLPEGHWNATGHRVAADIAASEIAGRRLLAAPATWTRGTPDGVRRR